MSIVFKNKNVFKQLQKQKTNHTKRNLTFSVNKEGKPSMVTCLRTICSTQSPLVADRPDTQGSQHLITIMLLSFP